MLIFNVARDSKILSNDEFNRGCLFGMLKNLSSLLADNEGLVVAIKSLTCEFDYLNREFDTECSG